SGDSLTSIARKYGISVKVLQDINGGPDQLKTLSVGQKLVLPY
ncbi:MAG: LysM peptidoglycan-binding domain-containing protein, partial [Mailhella sp.]|nr:LysM peptidoglycan-binding domain-containing protein [Mailhella sp.]